MQYRSLVDHEANFVPIEKQSALFTIPTDIHVHDCTFIGNKMFLSK